MYLSAWGGIITEVAYGTAIVLTILVIKPLDLILDKILKKPKDPKMLCLIPTVQGVIYMVSQGKHLLFEGTLDWDAWESSVSVETNEIWIKGMALRIGANTIESIYPKDKQHLWMDRPEEKIRNSLDVGTILKNFEGYRASLEEQKKEEEWIRQCNVKCIL